MWTELIFIALIWGIFLPGNSQPADFSFDPLRSPKREHIVHNRVTKIGSYDVLQEKCLFTPSYGTCKKGLRVYGYSIITNRCVRYFYSGCGGNPNRFATLHECRKTCHVIGKRSTGNETDYFKDTIETETINSTTLRI
nr:tissue factor pathway inhibitor [Drosophila takahashii]